EGDLNGTVWGASRLSGTSGNPWWQPAYLTACGSTTVVTETNEIKICNGQMHEDLNDGGGVNSLAMYPKQPFDFANRTGTIVFDVSDNSEGPHAAWPELWVTDQPLPDPFTHEASFTSFPRNGFGIRFAGCTDGTGHGATCPRGSPTAVGVDSAVV